LHPDKLELLEAMDVLTQRSCELSDLADQLHVQPLTQAMVDLRLATRHIEEALTRFLKQEVPRGQPTENPTH